MASDSADGGTLGRRGLAARLVRAKRARGMTQQALAGTLAVSQATASKLLRGRQAPRPDLAMRIESFIAEGGADASVDGIDAVVAAYEASAEFRRLCHAALALMNANE